MSFFCHVCSQQSDRHYVTPGVNDLNTYSPEIAAEWDYQRNGELTPDKVMPFSNRKVWWQCAMGASLAVLGTDQAERNWLSILRGKGAS